MIRRKRGGPVMLFTLSILVAGACAEVEAPRFGHVTAERLAHAATEPGEWFTRGRDLQQTYYSPLTQINDRTVRDIGYAWHMDLNTTHGLQATPIVVDGRMYTSGPWGTVWALEAATGATIWSFDPEVDVGVARYACCDIVNRGVAVYSGSVFVAALDGRLFALDAETGVTRWSVQTIVDPARAYTVTGAPFIAGNVVVIGNSGAEYDARGYVSAYDVDSGELRWRFFTVPAGPAPPFEHPELEFAARTWDPNSLWEVGLGGTVWDGMAYDHELDLLYVGTGNATPYARKLRSPAGGDNLFLASILAIKPGTGRLIWHYQTTPAENWDYTATQKMVLAELTIDGRPRRVLMQAPKNGFFYVLDRATGELLSAEPYVPVNWASHVDPETGRPVETGLGEYWDEPRLVFPSPAGGHNWQPMAYNPSTGLVYIPAIELGAIWRIPESSFEYRPAQLNIYSQYFLSATGVALPAGLPSLDALALGQPDPTPRGFLRAWDPARQRTVWEVETSGPWTGMIPAIWNGGGVTTTAGNLVIQGRSTGELYFFAADSGELLHTIDVGSSIIAAPATYTVDGEQYIVVMAGMGGALGRSHARETAAARYGNQGRILAFKLFGSEVPRRPLLEAAVVAPSEPPLPRSEPAMVEAGAELFAAHCFQCHGFTGGTLDLRNMSPQTHEAFPEIVLLGSRASRGMGGFADVLTQDDVALIHAYLIDLAWQRLEQSR